MPVPAALARARAELPPAVEQVLRTLAGAGHRSWLVGGVVRDVLLGRHREAHDYDLATPATPDQVTALFRRVIPTGAAHGTVTVVLGGEAIEVTTFRGEGAYVDGRRPGSVTFLAELEADLARRDFTMNALAWDPLAPDFRDPFGGQEDIRRRLVRAVGDPRARFAEDGLRPMRAVRFAAQLGYDLEPATREAIREALDVVRKVSVERICDELDRLVVAPHAPAALGLMRATGLLGVVLPELAAAPSRLVDHAVAVLAEVPAVPALRLAALLHVLPAAEAERILVALRQPRRISDGVAALLRAHACRARDGEPPLPRTARALRRWLSEVGLERAEPLLALADAEAAALPPPAVRAARDEVARLASDVDALLRARPPLFPQDLALDGRAVMALLGAGPGPHVGAALRHLLDRVLDEPDRNDPAVLEAELRAWWAARPRT